MGGALTRMLGFMPTGAGASGDPFLSSVVLLLGYNGADTSTVVTDESPAARGNATMLGSAQIKTDVKKFGTAALQLAGTGDSITYPDHADLTFGSGDFTVETWFYHQDGVNSDALITKYNGASDHEWGLFVDSNGNIAFFWSTNGSADSSISASPGYSTATWYHVAFSRVGNTGYLCFNGTIIATGSMTGVTIFNSAALLSVGANNNGTTAEFLGRIDETRITKGVGRYSGSVSSSYTVPTAAFPRS
jgi:hypothetical protein